VKRPHHTVKPKPHEADWFMDAPSPRVAVCTKCHCRLFDSEPCQGEGEFWHRTTFPDGSKSKCPNAGKRFSGGDKEIEPFMRKRERRLNKRVARAS